MSDPDKLSPIGNLEKKDVRNQYNFSKVLKNASHRNIELIQQYIKLGAPVTLRELKDCELLTSDKRFLARIFFAFKAINFSELQNMCRKFELEIANIIKEAYLIIKGSDLSTHFTIKIPKEFFTRDLVGFFLLENQHFICEQSSLTRNLDLYEIAVRQSGAALQYVPRRCVNP